MIARWIDWCSRNRFLVLTATLALVMAGMGGLYYWWPKMFGFLLHRRLGYLQFWLLFLGGNLMLLPMYLLGLEGMPRRIAQYALHPEWAHLNQAASAFAGVTALSFVVFAVNVVVSWRRPIPAGDDPWGGHTLEWSTSSPPPAHNFTFLPRIRSERPTWDHHHPEAHALPHGSHRARHEHAGSS